MDHVSESSRRPAANNNSTLLQDWLNARARIHSDLVLKLAHWSQLPWKLAGLAHQDPWKVQATAKIVLMLWDHGDVRGKDHVLSKRLLDPTWSGLNCSSSDPPLRGYVEQLAKGVLVGHNTKFMCSFC
jgi:hypothetical protein